MKNNPVLALVGSSGVGKTTLLMEVLREMPDQVFPVRVHTNRAKRGPEDDIFCKFVTAEQITAMMRQGELAQYLEYGNNVYGCAKADIDWAIEQGIGAQAFVQTGVMDLRNAGYEVLPVKITSDRRAVEDNFRRAADLERAKLPLDYILALHNSFEAGGLQKTVGQLTSLINSLIKAKLKP